MGQLPEDFGHLTGFEWDAGNSEKNWLAHDVTRAETEQTFFNRPAVISADIRHSKLEARYFMLGRTNGGRRLAVVFTIRGGLVRPIIARDMSRRERRYYEEQQHAEASPESNSEIP